MSLPSNPLPEPEQGLHGPSALAPERFAPQPELVAIAPPEPALPAPPASRFPAWSWWDALAVLGFTLFGVFLFSLVALAIARHFPEYRRMPISELATDARIVVGAQATAYPVVLIFILILVRTRTHERFRDAIRWNWPGMAAPGFFLAGTALALVVDWLSRFLPIPKSLPMDQYFHDASSAYLLAAFGLSLAPLLEEVFFRGMLYPLMRRAFGLTAAIVLTAAAFAAIHGAQLGYAWGPILSIFVVGLVFTFTRERVNSVAASFLMHCGYNSALFTALWVASDHFRHLEKVTG
jgi:membrane protease YdiL (CAAX protease family)